jgi:prepilin-type N-terminal cleavage/methylation domain-containing protein
MRHRTLRPTAFSLIELLIVVAVIAILAAIAVPNLLQAQTRAKVSRALADMRTLATALETYVTDNQVYPPSNAWGTPGNRTPALTESDLYLERLSTPVAYLTQSFFPDPFQPDKRISIAEHDELPGLPGIPLNYPPGPQWDAYTYTSWNSEGRTTATGDGFDIYSVPRAYLLQSSGPDGHYFNVGGILANFTQEQTMDVLYDATNGTVSYGAIFRVGGDFGGAYGIGFTSAVLAAE